MANTNSNNEIPIFTFLKKHKWRIILPMLFALFYFALPRYLAEYTAVQQGLFIKSATISQPELQEEVIKIKDRIYSRAFLLNLIEKFDLYQKERSKNVPEYVLLDKITNSINIDLPDWEYTDGLYLNIWIDFRTENAQNIAELSKEVTKQFENNPNFQTNKYVSKPYEANPWRNYVFFGGLMQGFIMLVIPLILIWEIPNLFYSPKTRTSVFEPIKSDWQNELFEAKLRNETLKTIEINFRYSFAYLSSMIQKSPIGDFIEFVRKIAS